MKTLIPAAIRCSLMFIGVAALSIVYPASVQAVPTTYQYTGNPFTVATGPYTTSDFVTAMVTLAGPLGANMPLTHVNPTAFTFFDGVQTLNSTNSHPNPIAFSFATNANGEIISWAVETDGGGSSIFTFNDVPGAADGGHTSDAIGSNRDSPGVWSQGIATPDAGSTLSLMTLTLMALGLVARRFHRVAGLTAPGLAEVASWRSATRPASRFQKRSRFFSRAVSPRPLQDKTHRELVNRPLQFHKRSEFLVRPHDETLSVAMRVCNPPDLRPAPNDIRAEIESS